MGISGRGFGRGGLPIGIATALSIIALGLAAEAPAALAEQPPAAPVETPGVSGSVAGAAVNDDPGHWTRERMLEAVPAEDPSPSEAAFDLDSPLSGAGPGARTSTADGDFFPSNVESFPLRVHGKVFFRVDGQDFVCSGTVVDSRGKNMVFTAGHCVFDRDSSQYAEQLVFVPAFQDGDAPLGIWPATAVFTTTRFVESGNLSHDIGVAVLEDRIQSRLGARRIAFDLDPAGRSWRIFGYPEDPSPPFDGESLAGCRSQTEGRDPVQGTPAPIAAGPCLMGSGSSGGGWITGGGFLSSVVSYGYCESRPRLCGLTFGPFFSKQALELYTFPAVGGSANPTVNVKTAPPKRLRRSRAKFTFAGSGSTPVGFRCRLDRGNRFKCGKKTILKGLEKGLHVLRVHSVDQTGKVSRKASKNTFRVLRSRR